MKKIKKQDGFLGFRTTKQIETSMKSLSAECDKEISGTLNYLCRLFLKDEYSIRSNFTGKPVKPAAKK